jgi:hypothetical protein
MKPRAIATSSKKWRGVSVRRPVVVAPKSNSGMSTKTRAELNQILAQMRQGRLRQMGW